MWLLENEDAFQGRRLWLRPGKTYLFGRTAKEPGQLAILHNTISRKHVTVTVDKVRADQAYELTARSKLTIEDLATKLGTTVDGKIIQGGKYVVESERVDMILGKCPSAFRIRWAPAVFTFSFTTKELQSQPLAPLQAQFENLDIKLLTEYNREATTHIVARKRNTAKGLQALINAKYIVTDSFLHAIRSTTEPIAAGDTLGSCALEEDFARFWPDASKHLPPRGGEPVQHEDDIYEPDHHRKDVFDGYTFIFYDKTQYSNLLAPITDGGGKALLRTISPGAETVDDFVRFVKTVAGEKGLGSFEDGSEGRGVVVVRYLPGKGDLVEWYREFITHVSLRLDHRPIEQNEFLEAILIKNASILRRPLEVESEPASQDARLAALNTEDEPRSAASRTVSEGRWTPFVPDQAVLPPSPKIGKFRRPIKRRFAGFDDDEADSDVEASPPRKAARLEMPENGESGLFVSQEVDVALPQQGHAADKGTRKRPASPASEPELMDGIAPAVARFKLQRLEQGQEFASPTPEPPAEQGPLPSRTTKKAREVDILALAARNREEQESRARAEKEELVHVADDVDLAEIRRLHIVEEMEVRAPARAARSREQDIAEGRRDPRWNGIKDFKKFRRRGEVMGRQPVRVIVPLTQVKVKEFGVGDKYWLEDEGGTRGHSSATLARPEQASPATTSRTESQRRSGQGQSLDAAAAAAASDDGTAGHGNNTQHDSGSAATARSSRPSAPSSQRTTRSQNLARASGRSGTSSSQDARSGLRREAVPTSAGDAGSDDSEDELRFQFGRRR